MTLDLHVCKVKSCNSNFEVKYSTFKSTKAKNETST